MTSFSVAASSTPIGRLLLVAATIEVSVGALHFAMPVFMDRWSWVEALSPAEHDFVLLVTLATGILLMAFGATTAAFAGHPDHGGDLLVPYLAIKTVLWGVRLVLELLFPATLNLFWIAPFTAVSSPGMIFEFGLFAYALVLARRGCF